MKSNMLSIIIASAFALGATSAQADFKMPKTKFSMEKCMQAAGIGGKMIKSGYF